MEREINREVVRNKVIAQESSTSLLYMTPAVHMPLLVITFIQTEIEKCAPAEDFEAMYNIFLPDELELQTHAHPAHSNDDIRGSGSCTSGWYYNTH